MQKLIVSIFLASLLTGCSWLDVLDVVMPSKKGGIDTEIVIGDKKQEVVTVLGNQKAKTITNNNSVPFWIIGLGMLGWFLPTPQGMFRMWRSKDAQ